MSLNLPLEGVLSDAHTEWKLYCCPAGLLGAEALVAAIHNDIDQASKKLDEEEFQSYKTSKLDWTTCPPPVHESQDETPTCNGGAAPPGGSSAA